MGFLVVTNPTLPDSLATYLMPFEGFSHKKDTLYHLESYDLSSISLNHIISLNFLAMSVPSMVTFCAPAQSPDLSVFIYFLWEYLKAKVFVNKTHAHTRWTQVLFVRKLQQCLKSWCDVQYMTWGSTNWKNVCKKWESFEWHYFKTKWNYKSYLYVYKWHMLFCTFT